MQKESRGNCRDKAVRSNSYLKEYFICALTPRGVIWGLPEDQVMKRWVTIILLIVSAVWSLGPMTLAANTNLDIATKVERAVESQLHDFQKQISEAADTKPGAATKAQLLKKVSKLQMLLGHEKEALDARRKEISLLTSTGADQRELVRVLLDVPLPSRYLDAAERRDLSLTQNEALRVAHNVSILRVWVLSEKMVRSPGVQSELRSELAKCADNDPDSLKIRGDGWFNAWRGIQGSVAILKPLPKHGDDILAAYDCYKAAGDPEGMAQALIESRLDESRSKSGNAITSKMSFQEVLSVAKKRGDKLRHLNTRSTVGNGLVNYVAHANLQDSKPVVEAWLQVLATLPSRFNLDTDTKEETEASARLILAGVEANLGDYTAGQADYEKAAVLFDRNARADSPTMKDPARVIHDLVEEVNDKLNDTTLIDNYRDSSWNVLRNYSAKKLAAALDEYRDREMTFRDEALVQLAIARMGQAFCCLKQGDLAASEKIYNDTVNRAASAPTSESTIELYHSPKARIKSIMAPLEYLIAMKYAEQRKIDQAKARIKDVLASVEVVHRPTFDPSLSTWETNPARLTNKLFPSQAEVIAGCHTFDERHR